MTDRIPCLCPGCRRTTKSGPFSEWICGKHWRLVPAEQRRRYALFKRRAKRDERYAVRARHMWARCSKIAIEETLMGFAL